MLQTAVLPQPGLHYRLRLQTRSGETLILFDSAAGAAQNWQPIRAPLGLFSGQTVTLRFEILGENLPADAAGYWANPRLVFN